ncbi:hypothetical protein [Paraburkholderia fungorum]|jgi:hypothetical protein|uniref:hypothetical protein n=1 Tax=Paraburkholderia fungorum TaxID=134537 RepID=UPI000D44033A|nr:hypothetical protein [Paraburkholderia fungorum]PRZ45345.1 hypothetical protein BX589_13924 [Paraburkholderia fungorum]
MCNLDLYSIHGRDATDILRIWKVHPEIPYEKLRQDKAFFLEMLWQVKHDPDDYNKQL